MLKWSPLRRCFLVAFVALLFIGCSDEQTGTQPEIVAQVGERSITAREFQLSYEFGFSSLKKTPDRKLSYLAFMVDELILSEEGYRLGLDKTDRIQKLEAALLQELLVEELLRTQVSETITVSDEEIRGAIAGSKVRWKFRYWTESDLGAANRVFEIMQERGYENVVADRLAREEIRRDPVDFETGYLTWLETPPELLDAIKDLQIGELSRPIELDNIYFLIKMIDIRRQALAEFDYDQTYDRYEQILYQRKLKAATSHFVTGFMTAKNVVVKGEPFQILAEALVEWKLQDDSTSTFSHAIEEAGDAEPALQKINRNSEKDLITFAGGRWSLKEFIGKIDPLRLKITPEAKQQFRVHLKWEIGLVVRNYFLSEEAVSLDLQKSETVQDQLHAWRDKWVYQELRKLYSTQEGPTEPRIEPADSAGSLAHLQETQSFLEQKITELRREKTIQIYQTVLDSIPVTDFSKSRWANVFLYKNSSKRSAIPTVDPVWK